MSFNPDKCEVIRFTNKRKNIINCSYTIHGQILNFTKKAKYLGLTLTPNLSWSEHTNNITKKANSTRGFLQRNLRNAPEHIKATSYTTFVRPILEYSSTIWDPYAASQINSIEMVQRKSARYVLNDWHRQSSVTERLHHLNWPSLQYCRSQSKVIMLYRICHNLVAIPYSAPYFIQPNHQHRTRGHCFRIQQHSTRIDAYKHSFFPSVIPLWNSLDSSIVDAPTLEVFKERLKKSTF